MSNNYQHLLNVIHERKAVRNFDSSYKLTKEEIEEILNEAKRAPSSSNLQPWRFIVIQNQEMKKKVRKIAFNQEQVETCSAVIAVIGDTEAYTNIEKIAASNLEAGYIDEANMERQISNAKKAYPNAPYEAKVNTATFDAGLISMQLMLIAKAKGLDTGCMGGFNKQELAELFQLENRYVPVVLITLGKAATPAYNTTRLPLENIATFIE